MKLQFPIMRFDIRDDSDNRDDREYWESSLGLGKFASSRIICLHMRTPTLSVKIDIKNLIINQRSLNRIFRNLETSTEHIFIFCLNVVTNF